MAKKIIISFAGQPVVGIAIEYTIFIDSLNIVYANGEPSVITSYTANGTRNSPPNNIELKTNLSDTIDNTLNFFISNFVYQNVYYRRVNNTIEVIINTDQLISANFGDSALNISYSIATILPDDNINLRYFFKYTNIVNDNYLCEIYKKNNLLPSVEINGYAVIEKGSVKDHTDTIRGTGLSLELEATDLLTLEDLYSENEQDFSVKLYKNNSLIFYGFLKPDGVFQSFTRDRWILSLSCVDGLGALENLSFVQPSGLRFVGKMKAIDIIYNCLLRSGLSMPLNTSINTYYEGLTITDNLDILSKIYMNADRYIKSDNETIMSCEEVLKSVLEVFSAVITQNNGQWYIYKPSELYDNSIISFKKYDVFNVFSGLVSVNFNKVLGSQINNFYPHHCNGNQKIEIKGCISAFRLGYKYGFVVGILPNPNLLHDGNLNYQGWTIEDPFDLINDPILKAGFKIKNSIFGNTNNLAKSNPLLVTTEDQLKLKISFSVTNSQGLPSQRFLRLKIQQGIYNLKYTPRNDQTPLDDVSNAVWTTNPLDTYTFLLKRESTYELILPNFIDDGNITIAIMQVYNQGGTTLISDLDLIPNAGDKPEIGEFHTASRATKISSIVKENKTVYNGDNGGIIYLGAIFKEDAITPTELWSRLDKFESKPLLQISAEDELRLNQKPLKIFRGSTFGEVPYLSIVDIDNVQGKFCPIEYSYDTQSNITTFKLLELFTAEVSDIIYKFTFDYGNTVKPTIIS